MTISGLASTDSSGFPLAPVTIATVFVRQYGLTRSIGFWCIQGHCGQFAAFCASCPFFYASAIAHSAFRDQPRRRRPRPKENCPLRIRCASSMPEIVMAAIANDLNPAIDAQRRLMARWSCSMRLLRYLFVRTFTFRQQGCSRRSSHSARRLGTWPSSVTLRGTRGRVDASALRKNACAAAIPRSRRSRKSTVLPCLSTARYK